MGVIPNTGGSGGGGGGGGGGTVLVTFKGTVLYSSGTTEQVVYEYTNTFNKKIKVVAAMNPFAVFTPGRLLTVRTYLGVNGNYGAPHDKVVYTIGSDNVQPYVILEAQEKMKITQQIDTTEGADKNVPLSLFIFATG